MFGEQPPDDDDRPDESPDDDVEQGDSEDTHWLSSLLGFLDSIDRSSKGPPTSGDRRGSIDLDYDVSIRSEVGSADEKRRSPRKSEMNERSTDSRTGSSGGRSSRTRRRSSLASQHVTTRTYEDELVVTTDVSGTDPDDITIGFDSDDRTGTQLVIGIQGREQDRIDVPWPQSSRQADARINNGILSVSVSRDDSESASDDDHSETEPDSGGGSGE